MIDCFAALRGLSAARFTAEGLRNEIINTSIKIMNRQENLWTDETSGVQIDIDMQGMIDGIVGLATSRVQPVKAYKIVNEYASYLD